MQARQPGFDGIKKPRHFLRGFTLDAHGQAEAPHLQVADLAVQNLAHQIAGLRTVKRARAGMAAANFLEVVCNAHAPIVQDA